MKITQKAQQWNHITADCCGNLSSVAYTSSFTREIKIVTIIIEYFIYWCFELISISYSVIIEVCKSIISLTQSNNVNYDTTVLQSPFVMIK